MSRRPSVASVSSVPAEGEGDPPADRLEVPASPYALALWNLIVRPPRRRYDVSRLGPKEFRLWSCGVHREDFELTNKRKLTLKCSHFMPLYKDPQLNNEPRPVVIYLHANASCRLEALPLVPLFLPLGISLFSFDFAGCGESDGEYISLGWYERDDLAECVDYLRRTGKVSAIGLWGRSMGSVTALLHADRDHSIGGMVLDSPFCSLTGLAEELAQSEYLTIKVPSWLLSAALALGRMRIQSLCNFDIDELCPERHVAESFIPALFIAANGDDFIAPHHTKRLFDAYTGDKELELVEGDHNSPRCGQVVRKAVLFFCRAFRCDPTAYHGNNGSLAIRLGFDPVSADSTTDYPVVSRPHREEACRLMATAGASRVWLGEKHRVAAPFRVEGALQLNKPESEAGFCICLYPVPTEWGGFTRPPLVFFTYACMSGLYIAKAMDGTPQVVASAMHTMTPGVPVLVVVEFRSSPARMILKLGEAEEPQVTYQVDEDVLNEVLAWPMSRQAEATFFDCALADLEPEPAEVDQGEGQGEGRGEDVGTEDRLGPTQAGAIPTPVAPAQRKSGQEPPEKTDAGSSPWCSQQ